MADTVERLQARIGALTATGVARDGQMFVVSYRNDRTEQRSEALRQFGRWASNPDLPFNWYDAALESQKLRKTQPTGRIA